MSVNKSPENITPRKIFPEAPGSHIGLVVKDMDKTLETLSSVLGLGPWVIIGAKFDMDEMPYKVALGKLDKLGLGELCIEIIQPVQKGTLYYEFIKNKGEGIHHIATMVPHQNWDEVASDIEKHGAKKLASGVIDSEGPKWGYFEIEPGGLIIEIIDDKIPDWDAAGAAVRMS